MHIYIPLGFNELTSGYHCDFLMRTNLKNLVIMSSNKQSVAKFGIMILP